MHLPPDENSFLPSSLKVVFFLEVSERVSTFFVRLSFLDKVSSGEGFFLGGWLGGWVSCATGVSRCGEEKDLLHTHYLGKRTLRKRR